MSEDINKTKVQEVVDLTDQMSDLEQSEVVTIILTTILSNNPRQAWPDIMATISRVALKIAITTSDDKENSIIIQ